MSDHWWVFRDGWVEIEPGDVFSDEGLQENETAYVLQEGEDPMDFIGDILTRDYPEEEDEEHDWSDDWEPIEGPDDF